MVKGSHCDNDNNIDPINHICVQTNKDFYMDMLITYMVYGLLILVPHKKNNEIY